MEMKLPPLSPFLDSCPGIQTESTVQRECPLDQILPQIRSNLKKQAETQEEVGDPFSDAFEDFLHVFPMRK
jgi:hypothetical protein